MSKEGIMALMKYRINELKVMNEPGSEARIEELQQMLDYIKEDC